MNQNYNISFEFIILEKNQLFLNIKFNYNNNDIALSLAQLMQFLYEHENNLEKSLNDFLFSITKLVKKFKQQSSLLYGIIDDEDMGLFFYYARKFNIVLHWKHNDILKECSFDGTLPITVLVNQKGHGIDCSLAIDSSEVILNHDFLIFRCDQAVYLFIDGVIKHITRDFEDFILECSDETSKQFKSTVDLNFFLKSIYEPNKKTIHWQIRVNIQDLLPKEVLPIPVLTLNYDEKILTPTLSYRYDSEIIDTSFSESEILNRVTGEKMTRQLELEGIFQQDLMSLFEEYNIPFLLSNPGDIAIFLTKIVETLKTRDWEIISHVSEFNVESEPVTLEFNIQSSGQDWFSFDPNCSIADQKLPLHEIARLMVENQGYVKTKKGFVKLSKKSQDDVSLLAKMGAFKVGKSFDKKEISVLAHASNLTSKTDDTLSLIKRAKGFNKQDDLDLSQLNGTLRHYQEYGVHWMNFLSFMGSGGILADDMGLGKTVQTLAFSTQLQSTDPVLVICPTTVTYNWSKEIEKFLPSQSVLVYAGSQRHKQLENLLHVNFIVVSYGILKNDLEWLKSIRFKAIFVDEAQYMKNHQSQISKAIKQLQSPFKLAITGTPIENHLLDIWNLFDFVMPDYLGSKKQFELALDGGSKEVIKAKMKPFILRREKKEVLDSLPEKTEVVIKCPLSDAQMQLYKTVLAATKQGILQSKQQKNKLHMLTALLKLRQVCTHPELIEECKGSGVGSAKFDIIKEKCRALIDENHKVVLFSQFTSMLDIIQSWLVEEEIAFERIDGTVTGKHRIDAVDRFQESKKPTIFLISLKAGGVGINLTAADYVIHVDPWWNPAIESQATDRVHRMGQKNKVIVYKLISEDTIEEKIQILQDEKRQLLTEIVDIEDMESSSINYDKINELILA